MKKKKNENFCCSIASHLVFFAVGCCCYCVKAKTIEHKTITRWISITESVGKKRRKQAIEMEMKSEEEKKMCIPTTDEHGSLCAYYRLHYGCGRVCARISSKYFPFHSIQFNSISIESTLALCVTVPNKHHSRCDLCNTTRFFSVLFLISN